MSPSVTITVLITDLVGSTELLRHGPEAYDELRRSHFDVVRTAIAQHGGTEVKSTAAVAATPGLVALRAALAVAYVEADRLDEARSVLADMAVDKFSVLHNGATYTAALAQLAEVAGGIGAVDAAADLYERLLPYEGQMIVVAWGVSIPGAADRYLAICASLMGRASEAEERFERAVAIEKRLGARALVAHTRSWRERLLS